jgi:hypothetical protein
MIELSKAEALELAIIALEEKRGQYHFDVRSVELLGRGVPAAARKRAALDEKILAAIEVLKILKYNGIG